MKYDKNKKYICVDFDGVIHSYESGWKGARNIPDAPVKGAIRWLYILLMNKNIVVCIYSARSKYFLARYFMKKWLWKMACLEFGYSCSKNADCHNTAGYSEPQQMLASIKFPKTKPAAWITIDDRCICYKGKKHPSISEIINFKSWVSFE